MTYEQLKAEFKMSCDDDIWGQTMLWWFTVADEIHFKRDDIETPESWQFRPSPLGPSNDPDDYVTVTVQDAIDEDLLRFGNLLDRYASRIKHAGLSY